MNHLDLLHDLASGSGDVDPTQARSILNGAEKELNELKQKAKERFPDEADTPGETDRRRKPKSEYSRQERAEFYEEMRQEGKDPNEEWDKLPEE